MRRGHYLESQIGKVFEYLGSVGIHAHKNHAKRSVDGTYLEGEPFDYEVFAHGTLHCFDAKEAQRDRWALGNAKPSQVRHLLDCRKHGAEAYFLVLFGNKILRRFDVEYVLLALQEGRGSLRVDEGSEWDWQTFLSG